MSCYAIFVAERMHSICSFVIYLSFICMCFIPVVLSLEKETRAKVFPDRLIGGMVVVFLCALAGNTLLPTREVVGMLKQCPDAEKVK